MCGASISLVDGEKSLMTPQQVRQAIRKSSGSQSHYPNGTLVCVENTTNLGGGACYEQETLDGISKVARELDCKTHIDGARIFNAYVATGTSVDVMTSSYDSVSVCLSKGLGAPVGSVLLGTASFIDQAHRWRKMFGGGWRQAGMLAAAGLYALDNHVERLKQDHARAMDIATFFDQEDGFQVDLSTVQTNMVYIDTDRPAKEWVDHLSARGIDVFDVGPHRLRFVVHLHITDEDVNALKMSISS